MTKRGEEAERQRAGARRQKLTAGGVLTLPINKAMHYLVWDTKQTGLAVHVLKSGVRTYRCYWNYPNGPTRSFAIGRVEDHELDDARRKCAEARRLAKEGLDPLAGDPKRTKSFKVLFEQFTKDQVAEKYGSATATEKFVLNSCKAWHHRPAGTISWPEIKAVLSAKRDTAPHAANRLHGHLGAFFKWLVVNKVLTASPMYGQDPPAKWAVGASREFDWLAGEKGDAAIKTIWGAADAIGGDEGKHLKLVMITGKRRTAIERVRWDEIASDWYWNAPPGSRIKRLHPIPLPKLAQRILSPRKESGRVFASRLNDKAVMKRVRELTGLEDFIFHALRHLAETKCAELGISEHLRDRLFDHSPGKRRGSGKGYDKHDYRRERAEALELWAGHIEKVITPAAADNVRRLR